MSLQLAVCVTGAGAGVDSASEQEKLEARKMLENAAESHTSGARFVSPLSYLSNVSNLIPVRFSLNSHNLFASVSL